MQNIEICPFELRSSSEADYACLNEFKNVLRYEILPEDPPVSLSEDVQRWRAWPAYIDLQAWAAWDSDHRRIVAFGEGEVYRTNDNEHVLEFDIQVRPEYRRQGLARQMLGLITERAVRLNRSLMIGEENSRVPAGAAFFSGLGARSGLAARQNQLRLAELEPGLLARWIEQECHHASEFELGWWDARYPEDRIQQLADLLQVVANDQPRDTLEMEDANYTPEIIRAFENLMLSGGHQRRVLYVVDRAQDRIVGLTEMHWHPDRPAILSQGFTGILPEYRSRGLGRWLKAEMLCRALQERPEARVVRTGNANSNVPMLKINVELGFKPLVAWTVWQVETEKVTDYLASRADKIPG